VAWEVARAVGAKLRTLGYRVVCTKSSMDELVTNRRRAEIANESHASLMLRLHCDASSSTGFAVYYPTQKGASGGKTGPSDQMLQATAPIALRFYDGMSAVLKGKLHRQGLLSDLRTAIGSKQGALTGSIYSTVPTVLVEMVVLTNPKDEAFITAKGGRRAMVDALTRGVLAAVPKR
jgi:N-acetylmuramoyl-L-alanine amidase